MSVEDRQGGRFAKELRLGLFDKLLHEIAGALFLSMTVLVIAQVFFRNISSLTGIPMPFWTEDIARHIMPVSVFFGAAVGFQTTGSHIVITMVSKNFPPKVASVIEVIKYLLIAALIVVVIVGFLRIAHGARNTPLSTTYAIKLGWFHYAIVVSLVLKLSYLLRWLAIRVREAAGVYLVKRTDGHL